MEEKPGRALELTVHVLPVADVLQAAARLLPAHVGLLLRLQAAVRVPAQLGAGGDAAGGGVAHLWPACGLEGWKRREAERSSGSDGSPDPSEQTPPASAIPAAREARPHSSVLSWLPPAFWGWAGGACLPGWTLTSTGAPVDARRPLLAPLGRTWRCGAHPCARHR